MLSQETALMGNAPDIPLTEEKTRSDRVAMDCEGFQDLREWCSPSLTGPPQTPQCIDVIGLNYFHDTLDSSNVDGGSGYCFDNWFQKELGSVVPQDNQLPLSFENSPANMCDTITTNANNNYESECIVKNEYIVFEDLPAYEETIEISSDSMDSEDNMEEYGVIANTIPENSSTTFNEKDMWSSTEILKDSCTEANTADKSLLFDAAGTEMYTTDDNANHYDYSQTNNTADYENVNYDFITLSPTNVKQNNDTIIDAIIMDDEPKLKAAASQARAYLRQISKKQELKLMVDKWVSSSEPFRMFVEPEVTTPDVLRTIEQLETDTQYQLLPSDTYNYSTQNISSASCLSTVSNQSTSKASEPQSYDLTPPDTPKFNSRKRRRDSEDSDVSYVPSEKRYPQKRSKPTNSLILKQKAEFTKTMPSFDTPVKRGRPPKHRDSTSSSYLDDNSNYPVSPLDKYRERRDKNNEASRRSRYQRKQKDSDMVREAELMEIRNEELRHQAITLEKKTKILKEALFQAMLNNK